jgi:hypothetical protein
MIAQNRSGRTPGPVTITDAAQPEAAWPGSGLLSCFASGRGRNRSPDERVARVRRRQSFESVNLVSLALKPTSSLCGAGFRDDCWFEFVRGRSGSRQQGTGGHFDAAVHVVDSTPRLEFELCCRRSRGGALAEQGTTRRRTFRCSHRRINAGAEVSHSKRCTHAASEAQTVHRHVAVQTAQSRGSGEGHQSAGFGYAGRAAIETATVRAAQSPRPGPCGLAGGRDHPDENRKPHGRRSITREAGRTRLMV